MTESVMRPDGQRERTRHWIARGEIVSGRVALPLPASWATGSQRGAARWDRSVLKFWSTALKGSFSGFS